MLCGRLIRTETKISRLVLVQRLVFLLAEVIFFDGVNGVLAYQFLIHNICLYTVLGRFFDKHLLSVHTLYLRFITILVLCLHFAIGRFVSLRIRAFTRKRLFI